MSECWSRGRGKRGGSGCSLKECEKGVGQITKGERALTFSLAWKWEVPPPHSAPKKMGAFTPKEGESKPAKKEKGRIALYLEKRP